MRQNAELPYIMIDFTILVFYILISVGHIVLEFLIYNFPARM